MKNKLKTIISLMAALLVVMGSCAVFAETKFDITLTETSNPDGSVTITATSENGFSKTKPTWTLEDYKTYSKTFGVNQKYDTVFTDVNNNKTTKTISVTKVTEPTVSLAYDAIDNDKKTVTVTATLAKGRKFSATKPTWTLSADKTTYTKTVSVNTADYETTFVDEYGNKEVAKIVPVGFDVDLTYNYGAAGIVSVTATQSVRATETAAADKIMKISTDLWGITADGGTTFTKKFAKAGSEKVTFTDKYGNTVTKTINIPSIPTVGINLTATPANEADGAVKVTVATDAGKLKKVKPTWTLEDDTHYSKIFTENTKYTTNFTVVDNNDLETVIPVIIDVTTVDKDAFANTITVNEIYDNKGTSALTATTTYEFLATKPTWSLNGLKTVYSKEFIANQTYSTTFTSKNGMKAVKEIPVKGIKDFEVTVVADNATVDSGEEVTLTATAKDGRTFASTQSTWTLNAEKTDYTKKIKLTADQPASKITFKDELGNTCVAEIPELKVNKYDFDVDVTPTLSYAGDPTTNSIKVSSVSIAVTATAETTAAAKDFVALDGWNLSGDKKTLTKEFNANTTTTVTFTSVKGNTVSKTIKVDEIGNVYMQVEVTDTQLKDGEAAVKLTATGAKFKEAPTGWDINGEKTVLTKNPAYDAAGNGKTVTVTAENNSTVTITFDVTAAPAV